MKALLDKRRVRAKRRDLRHHTQEQFAALLRQPDYLHVERPDVAERPEVVPGKHEIRVDLREAWPNGRAYCSCGWNTGWIPLWDAEQRARWHRLDGTKSLRSVSAIASDAL